MPVDEEQLSRKVGDGSGSRIEDMKEGGEYQSKDKRADTRTTYYEEDIDSLDVSPYRKRELKRMLRRQEGEDYGEGTTHDKTRRQRKQQNREEWKRRTFSAYASKLELSSTQKERGEHWLIDVLSINSFGHYSTEHVIFGIITVLARERGRAIEYEEDFEELLVENHIVGEDGRPDITTVHRLAEMVCERVPSKSTE